VATRRRRARGPFEDGERRINVIESVIVTESADTRRAVVPSFDRLAVEKQVAHGSRPEIASALRAAPASALARSVHLARPPRRMRAAAAGLVTDVLFSAAARGSGVVPRATPAAPGSTRARAVVPGAPLLVLPGVARRAPLHDRRPTPRTRRAMSAAAASAGENPENPSTASPTNPIVQYVVLRKDLGASLGWPLGSICAQAAHAAVAAVWEHRDHPDVEAYCAPDAIDGMHKVVLEVKGETQLVNLAAKLADAGVAHKLWTEQPENFPTCLATRPCRKDEVQALFKKCNLAKGLVSYT
jgi:peptidyl-tRNA hydrolase